MATTETPGGGAVLLEAANLDRLHAALRDAGYRVIGPTVRDGAIVMAELSASYPVYPFAFAVACGQPCI